MERSGDRIGMLPDGVLDSILSLLPMKHAIRTSILSRRWINLWKSSLSHAILLDFSKEFAKDQTNEQFVSNVNKYLQLHSSNKIEKFRIYFYPGNCYKVDLDRWIEFATLRGVKELDLILCHKAENSTSEEHKDDSEQVKLPDILFGCHSLIRLSLSHIEFSPSSGLICFKSLVTLRLNQVSITDDMLDSLLSNSPVLHNLCLRLCSNLGSIKVSGPDLQLRCLSLIASDAYEVVIFAPNLRSLHFYGDILYGYTFQNVAVLEDVFISADGYEFTEPEHDFIQILSGVSHIKTLTMCIGAPMDISMAEEFNPEALPVTLANLQELQILIGGQIGEEYLGFTFDFFKHTICPCLEKLFIDLSGPYVPIIQSYTKDAEAPSGCIFYNLKLVKISHFRGSDTEMKMVKFFLDSAVILESLVLVAAPNHHSEEGEGTSQSKSCTKTVRTFLDQLLNLPKASKDAQIVIFEHPEVDDSVCPIHRHTEYYLEDVCCDL